MLHRARYGRGARPGKWKLDPALLDQSLCAGAAYAPSGEAGEAGGGYGGYGGCGEPGQGLLTFGGGLVAGDGVGACGATSVSVSAFDGYALCVCVCVCVCVHV